MLNTYCNGYIECLFCVQGSCVIQGLEEVVVQSKDQVYSILQTGTARRQTAATQLNAHSRYVKKYAALLNAHLNCLFLCLYQAHHLLNQTVLVLSSSLFNLKSIAHIVYGHCSHEGKLR